MVEPVDLSEEAIRVRDLEARKEKARAFYALMNRTFKGISPPSKARAEAALRYADLTEDDLK